jgi:Na+-transporting NADH:ubiquinone oxidoreductase subunit NqrF
VAKPHGLNGRWGRANSAKWRAVSVRLTALAEDFERDEGRALACCATAEGDLVIEAEIDEEPDAQNIPIRDFAGRVARIEDLTPTIKGVWIELDGAEGIHFQAGQYVNLALPDDIGSSAFSIASVPAESNLIELNVRRCPEARAPLTSMIGSPPAIRSSSPAPVVVSSCVSPRTCR